MMGMLTGVTTMLANAAGPVAERDSGAFALKPQSSLIFEGHQSPVRTLAHWEAAHRNVLADEPQLRSIIDNEIKRTDGLIAKEITAKISIPTIGIGAGAGCEFTTTYVLPSGIRASVWIVAAGCGWICWKF